MAISKVDREFQTIDVKSAAEEVDLLGQDCDLVYAALEKVLGGSRADSFGVSDVYGKLWDCLAAQVIETTETIQELGQVIRSLGVRSPLMGHSQRGRKSHKNRDQLAELRKEVCKHTANLRITTVLING